jgi:choline dehydrogenase
MKFDYVVVGAGSAGCVVASRLSEDPQTRVLLLEAGPATGPAYMSDPSAWMKLLGSEVDWAYFTVPQKSTNGRSHFFPRGKVLGGSSSINVMAYIRGHRNDFDSWARQGAEGWGYRDVLPYFRRMETVTGHEPDYRGQGGPMRPSPVAEPTPLFAAFLEAAKELHYPSTGHQDGSSPSRRGGQPARSSVPRFRGRGQARHSAEHGTARRGIDSLA